MFIVTYIVSDGKGDYYLNGELDERDSNDYILSGAKQTLFSTPTNKQKRNKILLHA